MSVQLNSVVCWEKKEAKTNDGIKQKIVSKPMHNRPCQQSVCF